MNIGGYALRIIYAIIACVLVVFLFGALITAFLPGAFSDAQIRLIDICIWIVGFCYVVWGETWFTPRRLP